MRALMEERRLEIKVGVLLVTALLGCVGLLFLLGELHLGGSRVLLDFAHSGGVPDGAPVKLAGVRVGRVSALELLPGRRDERGDPLPVRLEVEIEDAIFKDLRADARFVVATQGPLGEPFIEIDPGPGGAGPLQAGAVVRAVDPPRMDLLSSKLFALLDLATEVVGDGQEARSLFRNAAELASTARELVDQNGPAVAQATQDLAEAAGQLKGLVATASQSLGRDGDARRVLDDLGALAAQMRRDLPGITEKAQRAVDTAATVASSFTEADVARLRDALERYEKAGQSLSALAARADRLVAEVEEGKGTLGALAKDPKLYEDLKALVTDLKRHPWKVFWKN